MTPRTTQTPRPRRINLVLLDIVYPLDRLTEYVLLHIIREIVLINHTDYPDLSTVLFRPRVAGYDLGD